MGGAGVQCRQRAACVHMRMDGCVVRPLKLEIGDGPPQFNIMRGVHTPKDLGPTETSRDEPRSIEAKQGKSKDRAKMVVDRGLAVPSLSFILVDALVRLSLRSENRANPNGP